MLIHPRVIGRLTVPLASAFSLREVARLPTFLLGSILGTFRYFWGLNGLVRTYSCNVLRLRYPQLLRFGPLIVLKQGR